MPTARHERIKMTARARAYLTTASLRSLAVAFLLWFLTEDFRATSLFREVEIIAPLHVWGLSFVLVSLVLGVGAVLGREAFARLGLLLSAVLSAAWTTCFAVVLWNNPNGVIFLALVLFGSLTIKDIIVGGQPMRSPLEMIVNRLSEGKR